ncbi:TlpA family protein disulfide reductase [Flavobacterium acetivorans]|uniref:TlpA family protein disulfide reductase n=1 Tax=Flavobacterium acetivorans TaxID=2893883 RepID=UPI001E3512F3|nr:TlpA disulfide reductase family protein [Flavobacterium sp. F-29]UFH34063.1 TlpA family protein disulfide reductase [Flavobacterium sp. F-29]
MKKIFYILLALSIISWKKEKPVNYIVLSGKIENKIADYIIISSSNYDTKDTIKVSADGSYSDTLRIDSGYHLISHGKVFMRAYFEAGTPLSINFDSKNLRESLSFSGKGAITNNYLLKKAKTEQELIGDRNAYSALDEAAFKAKATQIKKALIQLVDSTPNLSTNYKEQEKRNINYEYISKLLGYEKSYAYASKNPDFVVSNGFLPDLSKFDYNNGKDYLFSASYKRIVKSYYKNKAATDLKLKDSKEDIAYLKTISQISDETIKNSLLYDEARQGINYTTDLEAFYAIFNNASTNQNEKSKITESYNILKTTTKGKPSPKFVDYENNAGGKTSLDDLKGKYIYIDVWATWCGPCRKEIPFLKEVEKAYHGKNIEFVSISIDKQTDHAKWKKMIVDQALGGIQLLADKDWASQFVQDYLIQGIPHFILLDPNGNIVTPNAPRPSEKELITLFDSLKI